MINRNTNSFPTRRSSDLALLDRGSRRPRAQGSTSSNRSFAAPASPATRKMHPARRPSDRKSTRLNSSHVSISYAVFSLKKKNLAQLSAAHQPVSQHHSES